MSDTQSITLNTTPETGPLKPEVKAEDAPKPREDGKPAWLPEQFKSEEDFAKNWQDQRAEITRLQQAAKKEPAKADEGKEPEKKNDLSIEKKEGDGDKADDAAKKVVEKAGLDVTPWQDEFSKTGNVSPEGRKAIAEGLKSVLGDDAEAVVNDYIEGQIARRDNYRNDTLAAVGGEERFKQIANWASQNMDEKDLAAYNEAVDSGDPTKAKLALKGVEALYVKANGSPADIIDGDNGGDVEAAGFRSVFEMVQAMNKKDDKGRTLYKVDPDYRASVEKRARLSNFNK